MNLTTSLDWAERSAQGCRRLILNEDTIPVTIGLKREKVALKNTLCRDTGNRQVTEFEVTYIADKRARHILYRNKLRIKRYKRSFNGSNGSK